MGKDQEVYQRFIFGLLSKTSFLAGREIVKALTERFSISDENARKIIQRTAESRMIDSTKPITFGKGQFIYMLPGKVIDLGAVKRICDRYRPPLYRIIDVLEQNDGVLSYYEALKLSASPEEKTSTKANTVDDLVYILVKLELAYVDTDENGIRYIIDKEIEDPQPEMALQYSKMVQDCMFIPDILRWLRKVNIIDNLKTVYRSKTNPSKGAVHNSLPWDAFAYTKTTGINEVHGKEAKELKNQTLVVLDIIISREYCQSDLNGFLGRVQVNLNAVKEGKRKIMPIVFYKTISERVQNTIASLGFLSFQLGTIFGGRVNELIEKVSLIQRSSGIQGDELIPKEMESLLSTIRETGQEENLSNLKGILFEFLLYPLIRAVYGNAGIIHGRLFSRKNPDKSKEGYEYDFVIRSETPKEIVVIEAKGYSPDNRIPVGRSDMNNTLSWFYGRTLPFLKTFYTKEIAEGYKFRACYITSAGFFEDGIAFLNAHKKLKSRLLAGYYDGAALLQLLAELELSISRDTLEKYYLTKREDDFLW